MKQEVELNEPEISQVDSSIVGQEVPEPNQSFFSEAKSLDESIS